MADWTSFALLAGVALVGVLLIEYYFHRRKRHYDQLKSTWSQEE